MAETTALEPGEWQTALERITESHEGRPVTIEVLDPTVGAQHEAERLPFSSIAYDPKDDIVIVAVGGDPPRYPVVLNHMVPSPREIDVAIMDPHRTAVRVVADTGTITLITIHPLEEP